MKKLLLCAAAVLCVAASIFGGYYYFANNEQITVQQNPFHQKTNVGGNEATDKDIPFKVRGGAWFDENGNIAENGIADALAQREFYLAENMPPDGFGDKNTGSGIPGVPTNWVPRGPQNLGGRTESIVLHPDFASNGVMWAGGSTGGVWKSSDGGLNWNSTNTMLDNYNVSCLALDPAEPKILYAGTGQTDGASLPGGGVFKSYDGGVKWERMEQTYDRLWSAVNGITVVHDPQHPDDDAHTIVLAAVENYRSELDVDRGIMRSADGGRTWTKVKNADTGSSVALLPNDPSKAVAATCNKVPHPGKCKAWFSTDYGLTWSESYLGATPGPAVPNPPLFESPRAQDTIHFAFRTTGSATTIYAQYGDSLGIGSDNRTVMSRSTNGGAYFSTYNMMGIPEGISQGVHAFWVSPPLINNPNSVPIPDDPITIVTGGANLFRSTNDAHTFDYIYIANGAPLSNPVNPHVDMQTIVTDPRGGTNKKVFVATDGGIYHTENVTTATGFWVPGGTPVSTPSGWTPVNNKLQNTQYFSVAGDTSSGTTIIAGGTMDNGTLRQIGTDPNTVGLVGGDGGASAVDGTYCFGQDTGRQFFRINDCITASHNPPDHHEITNAGYVPDFNSATSFILDTDPQNGNEDRKRAFLGAQAVWRTNDVKTPVEIEPWGAVPQWFQIKAIPGPIRPQVTEMAVAPSDSNYMWVAENFNGIRGDLYRSTNALFPNQGNQGSSSVPAPSPPETMPTWEKVDNNGSLHLPNREITKILIDQGSGPDPDETVYVAFGGFGEYAFDNLWRTTNNGASWHDISGGIRSSTSCLPNRPLDGLPCAPVRAIARHPNSNYAQVLFVGTEIGIYVTPNVNATPIRWEPVMIGPMNVSIDDLNFIKGTSVLLAGTYGRGVWSLNLGPTVNPRPTVNDFDGDGRSDMAVVRDDGSHLNWHLQGSTEAYRSQQFGAAGDQVAPADYDGDGKTDVAVFRGSEQRFYCLRSSDNTLATTQIQGGSDPTAAVVSADFDGDNLADKAVWEPFTGTWKVEQSENGHLTFQWGAPGDTPVSIDIDGDAKADYGVLHEENGVITLSVHSENGDFTKQFGLEGDVAVPGEYDGDGKIDVAVWRPDDDGEGSGCWYITYGADNYQEVADIPWGENGDIPAPGDYDGDGKLDIAVWRPSTGMWHLLQSSNGYYSELFGADGDTPVGIKAVYNARPSGRPFTRVPPNAVPRRRTFQTDKPGMTMAD